MRFRSCRLPLQRLGMAALCCLASSPVLAAGVDFHALDAACTAGMTAYKTTTQAFVLTNCVGCHSAAGPGPAFAVPDTQASYYRVKNYVNFADIPASYFVKRAGNGHCNGCGVTEAQMTASLTSWYTGGESQCENFGNFFTTTQALPQDVPHGGETFTTMRWELSPITTAFAGAVLEVDAQVFVDPTGTAPGAYRFRSPRFVHSDVTFKVKDLKILVNGKYDPLGNAYTVVDTVVSPQAQVAAPGQPDVPYPRLSGEELIVLADQGAADQLSVSFGDIEAAKLVACKSLDLFTAQVLPVMKTRNCFACHSGGDQSLPGIASATAAFNMTQSAAHLCSGMLERTIPDPVVESPVLKFPLGQALQHPQILTIDEVSPAWTDWIQAERAP